MYTFDKDCDINENDKECLLKYAGATDNPGINITIGDYNCPVN